MNVSTPRTFLLSLTVAVLASAAAIVLLRPAGGAAAQPARQPAGSDAVVITVRAEVQGEIDRRLGGQDKKVRRQLAVGMKAPAMGKLPVRIKGITDPWGGMADLEAGGLSMAAAMRAKGPVIPGILDLLCEAGGKPRAGGKRPRSMPAKPITFDDHTRFLAQRLAAADKLRELALEKMPAKTRGFMHKWPGAIVNTLRPQTALNDKTRQLCQNDRAFCGLIQVQCDWKKLAAAAKTLSSLASETHLASLERACRGAKPIDEKIAGVTGDVLYYRKSDAGLIIIGGSGVNTYKIKGAVAVLIDIGGDDSYGSPVGASSDADRGNSIAIDLAGNDTYDCGAFGLATGRLGVGILVDRRGNDTYKLAGGSGGAGFGGIGILLDAAGDDKYTGSKFTQGAAVAGIGLLLDLAGADKHTSFGYAIGFGGPGGIGAVLDAGGNDTYQCGRKYPSGYNRSDNPSAKPGDPGFQYWAFGMGTGMGRRILSSNARDHAWSLAGGMGLLIDAAGDDRYDSSNFSQGCGYFFGVGLKLDLSGRDVHGAARYGLAAGAHFGMGLFVDYAGGDTYTSVGPTYNCGCAWDRSIFMFVDGGTKDDTYQLKRSAGLGRADINSWSIFADMGGRDTYMTPNGLGAVSRTGLSVFYDRAGRDSYGGVAGGKSGLADKLIRVNGDGGLFIDADRSVGAE